MRSLSDLISGSHCWFSELTLPEPYREHPPGRDPGEPKPECVAGRPQVAES
jgi:hypothetical protein